jgi:hypothetical protein
MVLENKVPRAYDSMKYFITNLPDSIYLVTRGIFLLWDRWADLPISTSRFMVGLEKRALGNRRDHNQHASFPNQPARFY